MPNLLLSRFLPPTKRIPILAALLLGTLTAWTHAEADPGNAVIRVAQGREIVPGGCFVLTEDRKGNIRCTPDDYQRMVRMGAGFQVIRTTLRRLGGWPGRPGDPEYLDSMVRMGRDAGLDMISKLVIDDLRPFEEGISNRLRTIAC